MQFLNHIKVKRIERRIDDSWFDMNLRQLRNGEVSFYYVNDFLTGEWLFKLCKDVEQEKVTIKSLKCPSGVRFSQLEGKSMVFQKSKIENLFYDVISLTQADENNELRRIVVSNIQEIPVIIKENFKIKSYEEATGKKAPGKHFVTLSKPEDEKELLTLFLLQRGWGLSDFTPEEKFNEKVKDLQKKKSLKQEIDTGQDLICSICGIQYRLVHVENENNIRHVIRKRKI